ncbi:hypothetical protein HAX54_046539 [Datura stramonium]|uniref:Uncharacterized protein n=1 Tax=Datura stramonium TaxID=4076 RepID=A0ABS8WH95_DATST|nr:hypothetical protein [Datura stramonium]
MGKEIAHGFREVWTLRSQLETESIHQLEAIVIQLSGNRSFSPLDCNWLFLRCCYGSVVDYMAFNVCIRYKKGASKMAMSQLKIIELEEGWEFMQKGVPKLQ